MKYFIGFILLLALACNDKPDTPASNSSRPRIITDTNKPTVHARNPYVDVDVSPMDMSYLPTEYPKLLIKRTLPVARVIYSRPHKQGRIIFGNLVKYGEPWRLGANEATEIEFFQPVSIQGKQVSKGKFVLYSIPRENEWTIVFNSNLNSWGLNLDSTRDVHRFTIPVNKKNQSVEFFSMVFQKTSDSSSDLVIAWDSVEARLPIHYRE